MKMTVEVFRKKTVITCEGSVGALHKIAPTVIFASKKERENLNDHEAARMDSLFKDWEEQHGDENPPF